MTKWTLEISDHNPPTLESDGTPDGLIQRKEIKKIEATDDMPKQWQCQMRYLTTSEYEFLKAIQNIIDGEKEV
jgi:hypothetical protein